MATPLFDEKLQSLRRARAASAGWRTFLHERVLEDLTDRVTYIERRFARALVIGWPGEAARPLSLPGPGEDTEWRATPAELGPDDLGRFDLALLIGSLESANDPRAVLHALRACLRPDSLLLGALVGGDSLPALRGAMLAADAAAGSGASPRVHPRIDATSMAALLNDAGFVMPVVDVDRVTLRYKKFDDLVADLRGTAATNVLLRRSRLPLGRTALQAARADFATGGSTERVDLVYFAGWTPSDTNRG
jgi:SAM-dependent methyltransferase